MRTRLIVTGSTGSIGEQTLNLVRRHPDRLEVAGLSANTNVERLIAQVREFRPKYAAIADERLYPDLKAGLPNGTRALCGADGLEQLCGANDADTLVAAIVGAAGIKSVYAGIRSGKRIALANKESLVVCGQLLTDAAKQSNAEILPVDSEHSAVFQCLKCGRADEVQRILLTASGGPFRFARSRDELKSVTVEQALAHPNWQMGKKISIDSATMMNKGLELIEARWLFDTVDVDYILHYESLVHSMVEFKDGTITALLSVSDMELPIAYALFYPDRITAPDKRLSLAGKTLHFDEPKPELFPLPALAKAAIAAGGTAPAILNAANEAAVALFLAGKIGFLDLMDTVTHIVRTKRATAYSSVDEVLCLHDEIVQDVSRALRL